MSDRPRVHKKVHLGGVEKTMMGLYENDTYFNELGPGTAADLADLCKRYIPTTANCWDIGANIGVTSQIMADHCSRGKIIAVEAGKNNYECLLNNIEQNGKKDQIVPFNVAVGDHDGQVNFMDASAYGYIAPLGTPTRLVSPQTLYAESGDVPVDFVKIDIEGFELPFLRAAMPIFKKHRTKIYLEFNGWCMFMNADINPKHFLDFLLDNFPYTYLMHRHEPGMKRFTKAERYDTLHNILVMSNTVRDIFVSMDEVAA